MIKKDTDGDLLYTLTGVLLDTNRDTNKGTRYLRNENVKHTYYTVMQAGSKKKSTGAQ